MRISTFIAYLIFTAYRSFTANRNSHGSTIFCRKYKEQFEGLDLPPYPGAKGQDIFDNISKKAWQEWMAHQTMLINENGST